MVRLLKRRMSHDQMALRWAYRNGRPLRPSALTNASSVCALSSLLSPITTLAGVTLHVLTLVVVSWVLCSRGSCQRDTQDHVPHRLWLLRLCRLAQTFQVRPPAFAPAHPTSALRCRSADCAGYLSPCRWDAEKLTERYFEDPEKVAAAVVCHPRSLLGSTAAAGCWDRQVSSQCCPPPSVCVS